MIKKIILLLIVPICVYSQNYTLSICTIFQNDAPYLKEWIEFHKLQGVEHFYLYNNDSQDHYDQVLLPYIVSGEVTLVDWNILHEPQDIRRWNEIQCASYMDCISKYGQETKWLAVLDTDEFLFCPTGKKLTHFLKNYKNYAGVVVNWLMFGTSHVADVLPGQLMIELLVQCVPKSYDPNKHVKTIVQPKFVVGWCNPHYCQYAPEKFSVNVDENRVDGPFSEPVSLDKIRINHYWTRTEKYLQEQKVPRREHMCGDGEKTFKTAQEMNVEEDKAILQFVPKLKKRMQD